MYTRYEKIVKRLDVRVAGLAVMLILLFSGQWTPTAHGGRETIHAPRRAHADMVTVKGGCYEMGDVHGNNPGRDNPPHTVCVDDFYMGKYEVTVGEFSAFTEDTGYRTEAERQDGCHSWVGNGEKKEKEFNWRDPNFTQSDSHPVVCVSWNDANEYIRWLNSRTGRRFRLPTEAEWEYAARSGGKDYRFAWGKGSASGNITDVTAFNELLDVEAHHEYNDGYAFTSPVGGFNPNELGLYDMSGNVYEWVSDWYGSGYYRKSPRRNPQGPETGSIKIMRGGSWNPLPALVQTTDRRGNIPGARASWIGFRLAHPR